MSSDGSPLDTLLKKLRAGETVATKSLDEIRAARGLAPADPHLDALVSKLRSGKRETADEGLKELCATGDGALFDRLLEGASFEEGAARPSNLLPSTLPGVLFTILMEAPESSKLAGEMRASITRHLIHPDVKGGSVDGNRLFSRLPNLTSLDVRGARLTGTAKLPHLRRLTITDSEIEDLVGLVSSVTAITLSNVKLAGGAEMQSLDALEGATSLEWLTVQLPSLVDVRALASTLNLRCLKLEGCSKLADINALEGHPSLRAVGLFGTAVDMKGVVKPLRELCSWAKNPNYDKMLKKPPQAPRGAPPKPAPSAAAKNALAELKALLATSDREAMSAWLAKIAALGDAAIYDSLLERVSFDPDSKKNNLASRSYRGPLGVYAILGLLAGAPATSRVASNLRTAVKDLKISGPETDGPPACPLDLLHLQALPNLETVELRSVGPFVDRGAEKLSLPLVRAIDFFDIPGLENLEVFGDLPKLDSLDVSGCDDFASVGALAGNTTISRLTLWNLPTLKQLKGLSGMPALYSLTIAHCPGLTSLDGLEELPELAGLYLKGCPNITNIEAILGLSALERIDIKGLPAATSLEPILNHPQLESAQVNGERLRG